MSAEAIGYKVDESKKNKNTQGEKKSQTSYNGDESDDSEESSSSDIPCGQGSPKRQKEAFHYNVMDDNGVDWTTVISKKDRKERTRERERSNSSDDVHPRAGLMVNLPPIEYGPSSSRADRAQTTTQQNNRPLYSQQVKKGSASDRQTPMQASNSRVKPMVSLKGIKQERSVALYLKSIAVNNETDEDIGCSIRDYANSKGIRVMGYHVIRYKTCNDAVGCKIFVPESQQNQAMDPQVWPRDITCRRWERPDVWQDRRRREQKRQYDERLMRNDGRNEYEGDVDSHEYYERRYIR